jgi:hypothetical protein
VLANYNRRHTLNVEYFEALQMYKIQTQLVGWERCLFVLLVLIDFSQPGVIKKHATQLIGIFKELGRNDLVERISHYTEQQGTPGGWGLPVIASALPVSQVGAHFAVDPCAEVRIPTVSIDCKRIPPLAGDGEYRTAAVAG